MRSNIFQRTQEVMRAVTSDRRRYKELEEETGVRATNWQSAAKGKQRPTAAMIEALGRRWPQYAFWMATGLTDAKNGHTAPPDAWPCGEDLATPEEEAAALHYFELKILVQDSVYGMADETEPTTPIENINTDGATNQEEDRSPSPTGSTIKNAVHQMFAEMPKSTRKPQSDLDYAIARIAHEKRTRSLQAKFRDIEPNRGYVNETLELKDRLAAKRQHTTAIERSKNPAEQQ